MAIFQMSWGRDNGGHGPWGRPSGGGNPGGGGLGGGKGPQQPPPPDIDDLLRKGGDALRQLLGGNDGKRGGALLAGLALLAWAASGIYFVKADEEGVVLRFGRFYRTTPPGIGYHLPYPIESVIMPRVTNINRVESGYRSAGNDVPEESLMLTGDENIVDINFEVQWKIAKAEAFLFNVRNPEET